MPALVAALVAALALGAEPRPARAGEPGGAWRERNAARARAGLLPRKAPATRPRTLDGRGRRIVRFAPPPPTLLGEPAAPPEIAGGPGGARAQPARWTIGPAAPRLRVAAEGVVTELAVAPRRPRRAGLALAATGVATEVLLTLRMP